MIKIRIASSRYSCRRLLIETLVPPLVGPGIEIVYNRTEIEDGQAQRVLQRLRIGRQHRAFEQHRAELAMLLLDAAADGDELGLDAPGVDRPLLLEHRRFEFGLFFEAANDH